MSPQLRHCKNPLESISQSTVYEVIKQTKPPQTLKQDLLVCALSVDFPSLFFQQNIRATTPGYRPHTITTHRQSHTSTFTPPNRLATSPSTQAACPPKPAGPHPTAPPQTGPQAPNTARTTTAPPAEPSLPINAKPLYGCANAVPRPFTTSSASKASAAP